MCKALTIIRWSELSCIAVDTLCFYTLLRLVLSQFTDHLADEINNSPSYVKQISRDIFIIKALSIKNPKYLVKPKHKKSKCNFKKRLHPVVSTKDR